MFCECVCKEEHERLLPPEEAKRGKFTWRQDGREVFWHEILENITMFSPKMRRRKIKQQKKHKRIILGDPKMYNLLDIFRNVTNDYLWMWCVFSAWMTCQGAAAIVYGILILSEMLHVYKCKFFISVKVFVLGGIVSSIIFNEWDLKKQRMYFDIHFT